jgi:hypothetical protein
MTYALIVAQRLVGWTTWSLGMYVVDCYVVLSQQLRW